MRWRGQASGTRASATQLPWERDPHKAPKLGIPPGAVSPAMCRRLSGHAILCSQGKWGRGGVPRPLFPGTSLPSPGVRRTFHHPGNVRVLEVKIYYFFSCLNKLGQHRERRVSQREPMLSKRTAMRGGEAGEQVRLRRRCTGAHRRTTHTPHTRWASSSVEARPPPPTAPPRRRARDRLVAVAARRTLATGLFELPALGPHERPRRAMRDT